ncbi:MAG TPA: radical SAM family heme chaperone HemW [Anaerolineales bacterium]|nr:radical SAM family heme chaperone HemW [Anaerolineales bacterium]
MQSHAIYIHIPFCVHRCAYCDFNTYAGQDALIPRYVEALCREIQTLTDSAPQRFPVDTVYFGGGTPSLLPSEAFPRMLEVLARGFDLTSEPEITIEANPGTLSAAYLRDLRAAGVNRLSLGVQSADAQELAFLERQHNFDEVIQSIDWARQAGFDNLSLDLIFGLPEQRLETWADSLSRALKLAPQHLSLYALTIEHGTPLQARIARGLTPMPDPDLAAEMYDLARARLAAAGFVQYEISNWALDAQPPSDTARRAPLLACRHNLQYWRNQPYFGFGAGAHGFVGGLRTTNVLSPGAYIKRLFPASSSSSPARPAFPRTPATISALRIDRETEIGETMMMGLRLTREGVSRARFQARFGADFADIFAEQIARLLDFGLLEWVGEPEDALRLSPRGYLLGNRVFQEFV